MKSLKMSSKVKLIIRIGLIWIFSVCLDNFFKVVNGNGLLLEEFFN